MSRRPHRMRSVGRVVITEAVASARSALWPLARLDPMPAPPPRTSPPVVLVHGFLGHPDAFRPLTRALYAAGRAPVRRPHYPSTRSDLEAIVRVIDRTVRAQGEPVDLVGHSLGAVACRAYVRAFGGARFVRRLVALGGPHAGTVLYRLTPPWLWDVLNPDGPWVQRLGAGPEPVPTVVIRARYDHQVLPPVAASLPGVREIVLEGTGHNGLLWDHRAHDAVVQVLGAPARP